MAENRMFRVFVLGVMAAAAFPLVLSFETLTDYALEQLDYDGRTSWLLAGWLDWLAVAVAGLSFASIQQGVSNTRPKWLLRALVTNSVALNGVQGYGGEFPDWFLDGLAAVEHALIPLGTVAAIEVAGHQWQLLRTRRADTDPDIRPDTDTPGVRIPDISVRPDPDIRRTRPPASSTDMSARQLTPIAVAEVGPDPDAVLGWLSARGHTPTRDTVARYVRAATNGDAG